MERRHRAGAAERRSERAATRRTLGSRVISVANLVGAPVRNPDGTRVGKVNDVVVRWDNATQYPLVVGVLVRTGRVLGVVPISDLLLGQSSVQIRNAAVVVAVPVRGNGRMALSCDVIDRQLIDVAGVQVVRAADAYLADVGRGWELAGIDVGLWAFLRRVLPRRRTCPPPVRSVDWSGLQAFVPRNVDRLASDPAGPAASAGEAGSSVQMAMPAAELQTLGAKQVAALLNGLGRPQQAQLASLAGTSTAAQALRSLEPAKLDALLSELDPTDRARLLGLLGGKQAT